MDGKCGKKVVKIPLFLALFLYAKCGKTLVK